MRNNRGITLITLVFTLIILIILSFTMLINLEQYAGKKRKANFEEDMQTLKEEISQYYARNKELPIINKYTNISMLDYSTNKNDNDEYYVIDIKKLDMRELKYGKDYAKVTAKNENEEITDLLDIYIINKQSHTIYYPQGMKYEGITHYTLEKNNSEIVDRIIIWGEENIQVARKTKLVAKMIPSDIEAEVTWTSSDETIAKVDEKGEITALKEGNATITATAKNDSTMKRDFEVKVGSLLIYNKADMLLFQEFVNEGNTFKGSSAKLMSDINLAESEDEQWVPINNFEGIFEGNNHIIENMYIENEKDNQGLFGINKGVIKNLRLNNNTVISTMSNIGTVAGQNMGKIQNIKVLGGIVKGRQQVGGISGKMVGSETEIIDSYNIATITYDESYGDYRGWWIGGIVGQISDGANILRCCNEGSITGTSATGGIVGLSSGNIEQCFNLGTITANKGHDEQISAGGITGWNTYSGEGKIIDCYNLGTIYSTDGNIGGIAGKVGGTDTAESVIENCYSAGDLVGNGATGIVGCSYTIMNNSIITNTYWRVDSGAECGIRDQNGNNIDTQILSKTKEEIEALANELGDSYVSNVNGYPILIWQDKE